MLILARKVNEAINIGDDIVVTVLAIDGGTVKLGVEAPAAVKLLRGEVYERIARSNREAAAADLSWLAGLEKPAMVAVDGLPAGDRPAARPPVRVVRKPKKSPSGE